MSKLHSNGAPGRTLVKKEATFWIGVSEISGEQREGAHLSATIAHEAAERTSQNQTSVEEKSASARILEL